MSVQDDLDAVAVAWANFLLELADMIQVSAWRTKFRVMARQERRE